MQEQFAEMLAVGGRSNSLGKVNDVIELALQDKSRLDELYNCFFDEDAWIRMRAADALEKICRVRPDWLLPYIDKFITELASNPQPSIQWHLAQIYQRVNLTAVQKRLVTDWLRHLLSTTEVDWIVAANAMDTLCQFTRDGSFSSADMTSLLEIQKGHKSRAVIKRAEKLLGELS